MTAPEYRDGMGRRSVEVNDPPELAKAGTRVWTLHVPRSVIGAGHIESECHGETGLERVPVVEQAALDSMREAYASEVRRLKQVNEELADKLAAEREPCQFCAIGECSLHVPAEAAALDEANRRYALLDEFGEQLALKLAAETKRADEARHHVKVLQGWVHSDICSSNCVEGCAAALSFLNRTKP